jgi:glycosyltransferase involved in cell wall biosynthesis
MNKGPLVSFVICSHNRRADVAECLDALIPQIDPAARSYSLRFRPENETEMAKLATLYPGVNLTRVDQLGLSLARNRGVQLGAYIGRLL